MIITELLLVSCFQKILTFSLCTHIMSQSLTFLENWHTFHRLHQQFRMSTTMICIAFLSLKYCLHVPVFAKVYISPLIAKHCLHIQFWPRVIQLAPESRSFMVSSFRRDSVDSLSLDLKNISSPTSYEIAGIRSHVFLSSSSFTSYIYVYTILRVITDLAAKSSKGKRSAGYYWLRIFLICSADPWGSWMTQNQ